VPADAPKPASPQIGARLARVRQRDTAAELALRSELHRRGLRYRVNVAPLPGVRRRADVVFPRARVAVFVDGCFWHGCPEHVTWPTSNAAWWREKIEGNVRRDRDTDRRLEEAGWRVVRVWEHEPPGAGADAVERAVGRR
jgi:DNA mismatch endonuclease (patch repair protein)